MQPDWDKRYRQGDTPWDKGRASPALIAWLEDNPGLMTGSVLVPGCGTGHDVRAIASAEPTSLPVGIDISKTAIEECRHKKVHENERYEEENLFSLPKTFLAKLCSRSTTGITSSNNLSTKRFSRFKASIKAAMDSPYIGEEALAQA